MQASRSALRLGCPVRFRDRWEGKLTSLLVDDDWLVVNVTISRGLFRPQEVRLPFEIAPEWSEDGVSLDCSSGEAFGREVPPVATPAVPLTSRTPVSAGDARLVGALVDRSSRRVTDLLLGRGVLGSDVRRAALSRLDFQGGVIRLAAQPQTLPVYRSDPELLAAVREALADHPYLTTDDRRALTVEVADGVAQLAGNVRTSQAKAAARQAAEAVPGLAGVRDEVLDDRQLEIDVARALDAAGLFRYGRIYVRAALGHVVLGGFLTSAAPMADIVRTAGAVPGVRSVEERLEAPGAALQGAAGASAEA